MSPKGIEEFPPMILSKGVSMTIFMDHSKAPNEVGYNWTETVCDGKPGSGILYVPEHWHELHDEIMEVVEGRMTFWIDHKEIFATPSTGPIVIPRGIVHGMTTYKGVPVKLREKTAPAGEFKALFFQDLFQTGYPSLLMLVRVFSDHDSWFALPGGFKSIDWLATRTVGLLAKPFVPPKLTELRRNQVERAQH